MNTCRWCDQHADMQPNAGHPRRPAAYRVSALKPDGTTSARSHLTCGTHLNRAVVYVTIPGDKPGSRAEVTRL